MKYRLLKDIGYLKKGARCVLTADSIPMDIDSLVAGGFIEQLQEAIWTDKDMIEFAMYSTTHIYAISETLNQFKKEKG